jgi:hypothetical protein
MDASHTGFCECTSYASGNVSGNGRDEHRIGSIRIESRVNAGFEFNELKAGFLGVLSLMTKHQSRRKPDRSFPNWSGMAK